MTNNELEHMNIWTKVLNRSNELFSLAMKENDPARAKLLKNRAETLAHEFSAQGTIRKRRGMTEEQLRSSISHAKILLTSQG